MGGVFANGLEISGKAVQAQTIAAFPDVCMTPPENPATPPGVPVPYPNFAMASDTEKGTGKVKIKDKEVNLKNKSDMKRTSGDEAGCAAKKGVITSKNMGKAYFNAWSPNVKFESKPVVRMSDITTDNHASPVGNTPPFPHIASMNMAGGDCKKIFEELEGHAHRHGRKCKYRDTGKQSEHTSRASGFMANRKTKKRCTAKWPNYNVRAAPCICMETTRVNPPAGVAPNKGMPHPNKTKLVDDYLDKCRGSCAPTGNSCPGQCKVPTAASLTGRSVKSTCNEHPKIKDKPPEEKRQVAECLQLINMAYLADIKDTDDPATAKKKMEDTKKKKICSRGVCTAPKTAPCPGC